jgi:hypothetical protein
MKNTNAITMASMVAAMFASGCGVGAQSNTGTSQSAIVKCEGINTCAGTSSCAGKFADGGMHDCAGKNSCAGQGFVEVARSECAAKKGREIK